MNSSTGSSGTGLAVGSLVLGILGVCLSFLLVGGVLAVVGLVLGIAHLTRCEAGRGMAWWGTGLSAVGLAATLMFGGLYYRAYQQIRAAMERHADETPFAEWEGKEAPDFRFTTLDGAELALADLRGKRVMLAFWATWCPPCRREIPHFNQLTKEVSADELVIVGISSEEAEKVRAFAAQEGIRYRLAVIEGDELPAPFNLVRAIPTTFCIDRKGVIQNVLVGYQNYESLKQHAVQPDFEPAPQGVPASEPPVD
ncbi:MAG: redoxin domain-containing protein [Verrucomicrobiae bacterium]|nr:redoxin domain-containing protein [Verrucomicrobiae bacterium]